MNGILTAIGAVVFVAGIIFAIVAIAYLNTDTSNPNHNANINTGWSLVGGGGLGIVLGIIMVIIGIRS